jgi:hypothetical protein
VIGRGPETGSPPLELRLVGGLNHPKPTSAQVPSKTKAAAIAFAVSQSFNAALAHRDQRRTEAIRPTIVAPWQEIDFGPHKHDGVGILGRGVPPFGAGEIGQDGDAITVIDELLDPFGNAIPHPIG